MKKIVVNKIGALAVVGTMITANVTWMGVTFRSYVNAPDIRADVTQYEVAAESITRLTGNPVDKPWIKDVFIDTRDHLTGVRANLTTAKEICDSNPEADCRKNLDMTARRIETVEDRMIALVSRVDTASDTHIPEIVDEAVRTVEAGKPESVRHFLGWQLFAQIIATLALIFVPPFIVELKKKEQEILDKGAAPPA